jgi:hypothetical protein
MKTASWVFWGMAIFLGLTSIGYTVWGYISLGLIDWSGGTPYGLTAVLSALVAFYLGRSHRSQGGELPEDRRDGDIDDGDPELGHFSPNSWWPFMIGVSSFIVFLGLAAAIWIVPIGAALGAVSLVGWVFQYYRGYFTR